MQLDVVIAEVRPGLTHTFVSGLRKPTDGPVSAAAAERPSHLFFNVLESPHDRRAVFGFLRALKQGGLAKYVAEPRLITLSGRPASFLAGGEQAVPVPAGLGQTGVQFEEFGTRLNFIPIVLGNGKIRLEVEPEVSRLGPASGVSINGAVVPGRITDRVNTTIELESGQTFVIGGLGQSVLTAKGNRASALAPLPIVGAAFRTNTAGRDETELVVLVTPILVSPARSAAGPERHRAATAAEVRARLRRLERQMDQLQEGVDALRRQLRSPHGADAAAAGER